MYLLWRNTYTFHNLVTRLCACCFWPGGPPPDYPVNLTGLSNRGVQTSTTSRSLPDCPVEGFKPKRLVASHQNVRWGSDTKPTASSGSWIFIPLPPHLLWLLLPSNVHTLSEARKTLPNHSLCEIELKCEILELGKILVRLCELNRAT